MAKLFTCERDGFGIRAETDCDLAFQVERQIAEGMPTWPRSSLHSHTTNGATSQRGLQPSAPQPPTERDPSAHRTPKARLLP